MTRFEKELNGLLGEYWKKEAQKELANIKKDLDEGKITIDEYGVARNCAGRALQNDMLEKLAMVAGKVSVEATRKACQEESLNAMEAYRASYTGPSEEDLFEMRAAYGKGTTVVDVIAGKKIRL